MVKSKIKDKNRNYLRRVFALKALFYPVLFLLYRFRKVTLIEKMINRLTGIAGISKNVHFFFKYKDFASWFRNDFRQDNLSEGLVVFPMLAGVNGNFTLLNLTIAKFFFQRENLKPVLFICDAALEICTKDRLLKLRSGFPWFCHECWQGYEHISRETGITVERISKLMDQTLIAAEFEIIEQLKDTQECLGYSYNELPVGKLIRKNVLRYFLKGQFEYTNEEAIICRKFLRATVVFVSAFNNFLERHPDTKYSFINNGTLSFEAAARALLSKRGITYLTYETFLGNSSLIYKVNDEVMKLEWEKEYRIRSASMTVDEEMKKRVDSFFLGLRRGDRMYAVLNREHDSEKMKGISRYACLFTNLNFDTAVLDRNFLFRDMSDWILSVIDFWKENSTGIKLVIRIHPGEIKLVTATREFLGDMIRKVSAEHPSIIIFDSDERINSYDLISGMEYGLIYSSTIGLEIAHSGKTCVVAGLPWFRNKSFVVYPQSLEEYFSIIRSLNNGDYDFVPDMEELTRTIDYVYFQRIKQFQGIKLYTPREEPDSVFDNSDCIIDSNFQILEELRNELKMSK